MKLSDQQIDAPGEESLNDELWDIAQEEAKRFCDARELSAKKLLGKTRKDVRRENPGDEAFLDTLCAHDLLSEKREKELVTAMRNGDTDARNQLITSNYRAVVWCMRGYRNLGLGPMDLFQAGVMGLIKGIDKYDPEKGSKLITYAIYWIFREIREALTKEGKRIIRLPAHAAEKASQINRFKEEYKKKYNTDPENWEIQEYLFNEWKLSFEKKKGKAPKPLQEQQARAEIRAVLFALTHVGGRTRSLQNTGNDPDGGTLGEALPDAAAPNPEESSHNADSASILAQYRAAVEKVLQRAEGVNGGEGKKNKCPTGKEIALYRACNTLERKDGKKDTKKIARQHDTSFSKLQNVLQKVKRWIDRQPEIIAFQQRFSDQMPQTK